MISIIVPVYNTEKYLDRCIQSILAQTYTDFELLLINDGSTDSSGAICDKYAAQDHRVRVFHKENGGASSARNMGLDNVQGEWIAFVDSDDWIDPEMYAEMYALAERESVDAVYCDMLMEYAHSKSVHSYEGNVEDHRLMYECLAPIDVVYFSMCNKLIARRVFEENNIRAIEGANMWEDVELAVRVRYFVTSSSVINKSFYHYNSMNSTSTTHDKQQVLMEGQIERVKQIESFFKSRGEGARYKHFVSLLKLHVKYDLFGADVKKWAETFKEARWSLYKMTNVFTKRKIVEYSLVSFLGNVGIQIIKLGRS